VPPLTPPTEDRTHVEFADWLSAVDDSLASGRDTALAEGPPPSDGARARKVSECLERLESLWPRAFAKAVASSTPSFDELARLRDEQLRGKSFGRFVIEREMGRGGHGVVFLAFDPALKRRVALKVPRPDVLVTADLRRRFLREAQAAAILDHPNIVPIYETGESGPACYLAAAYCNGPTLGEWLMKRSSMMPPRQAALIALRMAEALQHAHERQIFHRDFKPSNILLEPRALIPERTRDEGLPFTPKLTDFGLAKVVEEGRGDDTRTGAILGTPRYMSPEQAEGRLKDIGPATDVHGVGVTLYEMLAGQPPYMGVGDGETLHLVRTAEPTPPSKHRDGVPRDLEAICLKCLEKEVDQRYPTALALAEDLRRFLADQPTVARPIRWPDRTLRWARREPMGAAFAIGCVLAVLSIASTWVWYTLKVHAAAEMAASFGKDVGERDRMLRGQLAAAELQVAVHDWQAGRRPAALHRTSRLAADRLASGSLGSALTLVQRGFAHAETSETPLPAATARWVSASMSPEGDCLLGLTNDASIERLDRPEGMLRWSLPLSAPFQANVRWRWSSDGCRIQISDSLGRVAVVDRRGELLAEEATTSSLSIPVDRRSRFLRLEVRHSQGLSGVLANGERRPLPSGAEDFSDAAINSNGSTVFLLRRRGGVKALDLNREEVVFASPSPQPGNWERIAVDPSGRWAAALSDTGKTAFWDLTNGKRWNGDSAPTSEVAAFRFDSDGRTLVRVSQDGRLDAWHAPTGRCVAAASNGRAVAFDFDLRDGVELLARRKSSTESPLTILRTGW
jgi:hypothetical protein